MRAHASPAALPHAKPRRRAKELRWQIPIVDEHRRILGWTSDAPEPFGSTLRHAAAEKVIGGPVTCAYVQITDRGAAERAGAPAGWLDPWRCLAIVALRGADRLGVSGLSLLDESG